MHRDPISEARAERDACASVVIDAARVVVAYPDAQTPMARMRSALAKLDAAHARWQRAINDAQAAQDGRAEQGVW